MARTEELLQPLATPTFHHGDITADSASDRIGKGYAKWRRTLGLIMLAGVVFLWTASNFLGSAVLADETYNKPFFLTYYNTAFFMVPLIPALVARVRNHPEEWQNWRQESRAWLSGCLQTLRIKRGVSRSQLGSPQSLSDSRELLLSDAHLPLPSLKDLDGDINAHLTVFQTAVLGLEFCLLWFFANYWIAVSLEYTTVASSTILTSTSSVFTLLFGVFFRVEKFTWRKVIGILASLAGIMVVSSVDVSGTSGDDEHRGDFPMKSASEMILGNALAILSALTYGIYTVFMKKRLDDESKVSMPLFFGFVGLMNVLLLWPGFFLLHWTGIETFELPPDSRVMAIVTMNSIASLVADVCWAYAVLLTTPLVVTVGLSLTIPLSLIGQVVLNSQTSTAAYWVGAVIVVASFVFINHEEKKDEAIVPLAVDDGMTDERPLGEI